MTQTPRTAEFYAKLYDERVPKELVDAVSKDERQWAEKLELETIELTRQLTERDRQLAEAQRDAERYRWLCDNANLSLGGLRGNCIIELDRYALMKTKCVELDAAIDAAIQEQKK